MAKARRLMKQMNINQIKRLMPRRRRRRNTMLFSLLGIGIAGGATAAYTMSRGKGKDKMKNMVNQIKNKAGNINLNNMMKTTTQ